jgi:hypothetical protein
LAQPTEVERLIFLSRSTGASLPPKTRDMEMDADAAVAAAATHPTAVECSAVDQVA